MPTNEEKVESLGWLDKDGICNFPEEIKAVPLGIKTPGLPVAFFTKATEKQIQQAIDKGWIKFVDGNGEAMTFAQYIARYPEYPDPVFQLTLRGTFPPQVKQFFQIGAEKMSTKFYCQKKGGIHRGDFGPKSMSKNVSEELIILEGTSEKGPWYNAFEFSDEQIEFYVAKGWLVWDVGAAPETKYKDVEGFRIIKQVGMVE